MWLALPLLRISQRWWRHYIKRKGLAESELDPEREKEILATAPWLLLFLIRLVVSISGIITKRINSRLRRYGQRDRHSAP
jgi:hypothetical protein